MLLCDTNGFFLLMTLQLTLHIKHYNICAEFFHSFFFSFFHQYHYRIPRTRNGTGEKESTGERK